MAIYNEMSNYPNEVDELIFYSDLDLKHKEIADKFYSLLYAKKYNEAKALLESEETNGLHGNFASLYNMLENRIYNLQEHISTRKKRELIFYGTAPTDEQIQYGVIEIQ